MTIRSLLKTSFSATLIASATLGAWAFESTGITPTTLTTDVQGTVLRVGPTRTLRTIAQAAAIAKNGDTVEIDAGDYVGDVAVWTQDQLTIRGVGGRPRLLAGGKSAQGKAIWVVHGGKITVENILFKDAKVPDRNGAGIRFELGQLTLRNCAFFDNENGILTASGGGTPELVIENSEFGYNGYGDGQSHGLYVGNIKSLRVTGSYFHHGKVGHLIKSRASENYITYNRLSDETGNSSYELEFPNGGAAYVVGNLIQQSPTTSNSSIISYGAEGYAPWPVNELYLSHNTIIDNRAYGGIYLSVKPGASKVLARNNLLVGKGDFNNRPLTGITQLLLANNFTTDASSFKQRTTFDYRVKDVMRFKFVAVGAGTANNGFSLAMQREYVHPATSKVLMVPVTVVGAIQSW